MSLLTYLGIFSVYCPRQVVALKGSYHGDTLGAMEAQAPSVYTGFKQQPW
jgi:adenosylmethionine-8-amino-7-oxononanoate aminotransferase